MVIVYLPSVECFFPQRVVKGWEAETNLSFNALDGDALQRYCSINLDL